MVGQSFFYRKDEMDVTTVRPIRGLEMVCANGESSKRVGRLGNELQKGDSQSIELVVSRCH